MAPSTTSIFISEPSIGRSTLWSNTLLNLFISNVLISSNCDAENDDLCKQTYSSNPDENENELGSFGWNETSLNREARQACSCGDIKYRNRRIINGEDALPHEFPWRCHIRAWNEAGCGCTLISPDYVMTSARCTRQREFPYWIVLGSRDTRDERGAQFRIVRGEYDIKRHFHAGFGKIPPDHDIAILKLDHPVEINERVYPVCLPWNEESQRLDWKDKFVGWWGVTSGWGEINDDKQKSYLLKKTWQKVISNEECGEKYWDSFPDNMMCAMGDGRNKAIRDGDVGGSLDVQINERYYAIGINSWGAKYNPNMPDVYGRVSHFLQWIRNNTPEGTFCKR